MFNVFNFNIIPQGASYPGTINPDDKYVVKVRYFKGDVKYGLAFSTPDAETLYTRVDDVEEVVSNAIADNLAAFEDFEYAIIDKTDYVRVPLDWEPVSELRDTVEWLQRPVPPLVQRAQVIRASQGI